MTQTFFVDKSTGTFSDQLVAFGLARVAKDCLGRASGRAEPVVYVRDRGPVYTVECRPGFDDSVLDRLKSPYVPAVVIRTAKNAKKVPADMPPQTVIDYEAWRERRAQFFELRKGFSAEARQALNRGENRPEFEILRANEPHPDWDVFRAINPGALPGYNKLMIQWWTVQDGLPDVIALLRDLFVETPNRVDLAQAAWKDLDNRYGWGISATTSASQLFNPSQGKGQNRPKADRLVMDNIKDAFWLVEWLKAVSFYDSALTKQLQGVKDRKTYVLAPVDIDFAENQRTMNRFRRGMVRAETAIRSDIFASLRYTQALLEFSREEDGASLKARLLKCRRPSRIVAGFSTAYYKNLGNSAATMNMSFIRLPAWIRVTDDDTLADMLSVLVEHERIVRQFDESHSDDYSLLLKYRDFLSGDDLRPFLEFAVSYSSYLIGQRERPGGRARQFTTDNLRRLIMNSQDGQRLAKILETPGFQNIAYAIRQSTVTAQYRKKQGDRKYDVRYGLGQGLARKAAYPEEFVAALMDFLQKYNAENAQVMETRPGPYRKSIHTTDIDEIVALIDEYGDSRLICNLLIAYGYARIPYEGTSDGELAKDAEE